MKQFNDKGRKTIEKDEKNSSDIFFGHQVSIANKRFAAISERLSERVSDFDESLLRALHCLCVSSKEEHTEIRNGYYKIKKR